MPHSFVSCGRHTEPATGCEGTGAHACQRTQPHRKRGVATDAEKQECEQAEDNGDAGLGLQVATGCQQFDGILRLAIVLFSQVHGCHDGVVLGGRQRTVEVSARLK